MDPNPEIIECVKCNHCGKMLPRDGSYLMIVGAVYIGKDGGIIGSNPETTIWCLGGGCFEKFINEATCG